MYLKAIHFIKRRRWKAFFFDLKKGEIEDREECFGFKSEKTTPQLEELITFEEDLCALVKSIKFSS